MEAAPAKQWSIDFLELRPNGPADALAVQLLEAKNVVSSYSHAIDFLAEAIQNATDAIDTRRARLPKNDRESVPARIDIRFDCKARSFSVTDTGIGMSETDLGLVLSPNVSLKSGSQARPGTSRSRGHKGVGLSFLALASDDLQIRTCDGEGRYDVAVQGGKRWVTSDGQTTKPVAKASEAPADTQLDSRTYTTVTVSKFDSEDLEDDLFEIGRDALIWRLRTLTAIGNTTPIFERRQLAADERIEVNLHYTDSSNKAMPSIEVDYRFATLEELLPEGRVVAFDEVKDLRGVELVGAVRGRAVSYVQTKRSTESSRPVDIYCFAMDARDVESVREAFAAEGNYFPGEWQGTFVATRKMPTRVQADHDVVQPRAYRRRMFVLLQDDGLELDVGRKSLTGPTTRMLRVVIKQAWDKDLQRIVSRLQPLGSSPDREMLDAIAGAAQGRRDLDAHIPYLKQPTSTLGVLAVFHELVSHSNGYLPHMRTLQTGLRQATTDSLLLAENEPEQAPMHVLFATTGPELVKSLVREDGSAGTADLAVVWSLRPKTLEKEGVEVARIDPGQDGATHRLQLYDFAGFSELRVIELATVVKERG